MWEGLVEWMGSPDWTAPYADAEARRDAAADIGARVSEWTRRLSKGALYTEGQMHGVPVGPVLTVAEVLASAQLAARGFFVEIGHPYAGRLKYPALPFRFTRSDPVQYRPAPLLGQHNRDVYVGELGYSRRELDALFETGII
jgi:formyl-CoA transferase